MKLEAHNKSLTKWIVFKIEHNYFALPLASLGEIVELDESLLTIVPNAPNFLKGVINLKGTVFTVVDLAIRFNLKKSCTKDNFHSCIVTFNINKNNSENNQIAIIADCVEHIFDLDCAEIVKSEQKDSAADKEYVLGTLQVGKKADWVTLLDVQKLNEIILKC